MLHLVSHFNAKLCI